MQVLTYSYYIVSFGFGMMPELKKLTNNVAKIHLFLNITKKTTFSEIKTFITFI